MTWSFHYGEKELGTGLSLAAIDLLSNNILECLEQARINPHGAVWFQLQHPNKGGGIAEERLLITPGVPISFLEE